MWQSVRRPHRIRTRARLACAPKRLGIGNLFACGSDVAPKEKPILRLLPAPDDAYRLRFGRGHTERCERYCAAPMWHQHVSLAYQVWLNCGKSVFWFGMGCGLVAFHLRCVYQCRSFAPRSCNCFTAITFMTSSLVTKQLAGMTIWFISPKLRAINMDMDAINMDSLIHKYTHTHIHTRNPFLNHSPCLLFFLPCRHSMQGVGILVCVQHWQLACSSVEE